MSDIVDHPESYFRQFVPPRDSLLMEMEAEAMREEIPIIGPVVGHLLYLLVHASGAQRILELGTATGYSAIFLARAIKQRNGQVVTLESDDAMATRAQENLEKAGVAHQVEVRCADAMEAIKQLTDSFDFVFMDIEKVDYIRALPHCWRLLRSGGLLVADNVAFKDADAFNRSIANADEWLAVHLLSFLPLHSPENDGLCLAMKI